MKKISKKSVFIGLICITLVVSTVLLVVLFTGNSVKPAPKQNEYITSESLVEQSTMKKEGESKTVKNVFGETLLVKDDGVYKKSQYNDGLEKLSNMKIVPLKGKWTSSGSEVVYEFFENQTFKITAPYEGEDEKIHHLYGTGKIEFLPIQRLQIEMGFANQSDAIEKLLIDKSTFLTENYYGIRLSFDTMTNSENDNVYKPSIEQQKGLPENTDLYFEGLVYTYWLEDTNGYRIKMASTDKATPMTFSRVD